MIRRIEALRYRCLRNLQRDVAPFQILVGPNASGKTTFLDAARFLGQLASGGLEAAVRERTENLRDLFWQQEGNRFELAVEMAIPEERQRLLQQPDYHTCRYEVAIGIDRTTEENAILAERVLLMSRMPEASVQKELFPDLPTPPNSILTRVPSRGAKTVVNKVRGGNDNFYDETGKGWDHAFKLGPRKSALANLPEDESKFPVSTWLKGVLNEGIETLVLNSAIMRKPSPPGQPKGFRPDGSNLPWTIDNLSRKSGRAFDRWIAHVRTALPDLKTIETVERPEDKHRYLQVVYKTGLKVPSWTVSDGTMRLLALTLLAYIGEPGHIYLIEEPENGIHPRAVETVFQSLSSAYESQVLCATHSPVMLSLANPDQILCFARSPEGATDVVRGDEHPNLREWKRGTDLGTLFATGVLG
ncbi:MAG: AAA family ATPase [Candidatus Tectomicrobia bacterium]|nr:AAA family ATPase [Candidatus Tectomicrobia bacterium]